MGEICFAIPGTNEIGAKLTRICLSWMHRLVQFLVWTRGWRVAFHEQLQEKYLRPEMMQRFYINALNAWLLKRFRHCYGLRNLRYCAFRRNLLNALIVVEGKVNRWSLDLACHFHAHWLPCTLHVVLIPMNTVYFHDIAVCLKYRQRLNWGYIFVICDLLGVHAYTDVCTVHTQKVMSWHEVGGVIGSIKRLNKVCDIRVGQLEDRH